MNPYILFLIIITLITPSISKGQESTKQYQDTVDIVNFLSSVISEDDTYKSLNLDNDTVYRLQNHVVVYEIDGFENSGLNLYDRLGLDTNQKIIIQNNIEFRDVHFTGTTFNNTIYGTVTNHVLYLSDFIFNGEVAFWNCTGSNSGGSKVKVTFSKTKFNSYLEMDGNVLDFELIDTECIGEVSYCENQGDLELTDSKFFNLIDIYSNNNISISNCTFSFEIPDTLLYDTDHFNLRFADRSRSWNLNVTDSLDSILLNSKSPLFQGEQVIIAQSKSSSIVNIIIKNCTFKDQNSVQNIFISGHYNTVDISENSIASFLHLEDLAIDGHFIFQGNELKKLSFNDYLLSERKSYIPWDQIKDFKLNLRVSIEGVRKKSFHHFLDGKSKGILSNGHHYRKLFETYQELKLIYEKNGDIESANGCYAEMKQIETRRWQYLYGQNKSFETFFRWQLNAFLSYFSDYGTNPAKAVIKSGWVILLFSIFYLFFPSDWDVSNRSELLSKMKDLTTKNRERTFLATIAFVAYSGFIHVLNALTLSLNAFTTLGFGDIPTHGAARYVTIVQGLIGWFLLTIFSVSLINQVLG